MLRSVTGPALALALIVVRPDGRAVARLETLRADLLQVPELDATWVDFHQAGKPYGTAAALLIPAMAR